MVSNLAIGSTVLATTIAFVVAALLVPVLQFPARRIGLIDDPCRRKRHDGSVPLTGGLAMFLAVIVAFGVNLGNLIDYTSLLLGMSLLLAVGILDDLLDLRALVKLAAQVLVATITVAWAGLEVHQLGQLFGPLLGPVGLGPFSTVFTVISIVFMVNVINMADGIDGLAGGICLLFFAVLALIAWLAGSPPSLVGMCLVMMAATGGFLIWNMRFPFRPTASVFMGDAGSMMLGFAAAWLAIAVATVPGSERSVYPILIVWVLLVPSMDTLAVILRRLSQGRSPMSPDRTHLHHILRRCGLSVTATVGLIHLSVIGSGLIGVAAWQAGVSEWILFLVAALTISLYALALINAHRFLRWGLRRRSRARYTRPTLTQVGDKPGKQQP